MDRFSRDFFDNFQFNLNSFPAPIGTKTKMYNHLEDNFHLSNKKALFYNMKYYCEASNENVFDYIPVTFHI